MPSRRLVVAGILAFALLGILRFSTMAPDPWEWDEVLLTDAVQHGIDLRQHRPHPPGYPLLVESAALLHQAGVEPYRALAVVGTAGGILAAASLAAFLLAAGLPPLFAGLGALLYAFIPSVWLFGVRGFSDAPAAAACLAAAAAFLAASRRRDARLAALGIVTAAAAGGFRPQCAAALLPLGIWAVARVSRSERAGRWTGGALAAAALLSAAIWLPAVDGSGGLARFLSQVAIQADEIRREGLLGPRDLLSGTLWRRWLIGPFGRDILFAAYGLFALFGLRHRLLALASLAVLGPWIILNGPASSLLGAPRYAFFPLAFVAGLAAAGMEALERTCCRNWRFAGVLLVAAAATTAAPAVFEVSARPSPPVAAIGALRSDSRTSGLILHDPALRMHVSRILEAPRRSEIVEGRAIVAEAGDIVLAADRVAPGLVEVRRFGYRNAEVLGRISLGRLLSVQMGVAPIRLSVGTRSASPEEVPIRYDGDLPVAVDHPSDREVVRGLRLLVTGWCQERGGGTVEPVEFRIDGGLSPPVSFTRTARPDVARAVPSVGVADHAGYEASIDVSSLRPGPHVLRVTFRAADGRRRISPPVHFVLGSS